MVTVLINITHIAGLITYAVLVCEPAFGSFCSCSIDAIGLIAKECVRIMSNSRDNLGTIAECSDVVLEVSKLVDNVGQRGECTSQGPSEIACLYGHKVE